MKNTFVINIDEDVAAFLNQQEQSGEGNANTVINRILHQEKTRQTRNPNDQPSPYPQEICALMQNAPNAST